MNQERIQKGVEKLKFLNEHGYTIEDLIDVYEMLGTSFSETIAEEKMEAKAKEDLETRVAEILKELGISSYLKGYGYLIDAIILVYNDEKMLDNITGALYPTVAEMATEREKTCKSTKSVERAMRYAIKHYMEFTNKETIAHYLGPIAANYPQFLSVSKFIADICEYLHRHPQ